MVLYKKQIEQIDAAIEKAKNVLTSETSGMIEIPVGFGVLEDTREYQLRIVIDCNEARWMRPEVKVRSDDATTTRT